MTERDDIQQGQDRSGTQTGRGTDDRRSPVNPNDKPAPRSPEPEHEAVRAGEEKLERVKAY